MTLRFSNLYERLRSSLWLVPAALALGSVVLSQVVVWLDDRIADRGLDLHFLYPGGIEGSRAVLGALAGSLVSLTTISFSVMMVVLTLASNQFGPRVLRNFLTDRFNQVALGMFVATFLYCLLVLGRVPEAGEAGRGPPRLAVTIAMVLTVVSLGMLIGFIHHVARSIQATQVVLRAHLEERRSINALYPENLGDDPGDADLLPLPEDFANTAISVRSHRTGHVQAVAADAIVKFAQSHDAFVRLRVRPGGFVTTGDELAQFHAYRGSLPAPERLTHLAHEWIVLGAERTGEQDAQYGLRQLTEIAVRALSPGINDPLTAVSSIDYVGDNLVLLGARTIPSPQRVDDDGVLRAVLPRDGFIEIASAAFENLRHYGRGHPEVMHRLIDMLAVITPRLRRAGDRDWARDALAGMGEEGRHLEARRDRLKFRQHHRKVRNALLVLTRDRERTTSASRNAQDDEPRRHAVGR